MDKLKEEVVRDVSHLQQVLKICEGTGTVLTLNSPPPSTLPGFLATVASLITDLDEATRRT